MLFIQKEFRNMNQCNNYYYVEMDTLIAAHKKG
jgi:hypothetical protein